MKVETSRFGPASALPEADEVDRCAYNGAFWDIGFRWQWDANTYRELCRMPEEKARLRAYVERHQPHLFSAYDPDFLIDLILANKIRRYQAIVTAKAAGMRLELSCNGLKGAE